MPTIQLARPTGFRVDSGRDYRIFIDGESAGGIGVGETRVLDVPVGQHELHLKQDWASSEKFRVVLGEHEQAQFECAPRIKENDVGFVNGLRVIFWATLGCKRYIDLREGHDLALVDEPSMWSQKFNGPVLFGIALLIGLGIWALTGQSIVAVGVVVAAMALVVSGLVGRGIGKAAVQVNEEARKRGDD